MCGNFSIFIDRPVGTYRLAALLDALRDFYRLIAEVKKPSRNVYVTEQLLREVVRNELF